MSLLPTETIQDLTLDAVKMSAYLAHIKHGDQSILSRTLTDQTRLTILVEEVGEVAKAMTYDNGDRDELAAELLQVAAVALTWVEAIENVPSVNSNSQIEKIQRCADGGKCHHNCEIECYRVKGCSPLTGVFPDDQWPKGSLTNINFTDRDNEETHVD